MGVDLAFGVGNYGGVLCRVDTQYCCKKSLHLVSRWSEESKEAVAAQVDERFMRAAVRAKKPSVS